MKVMALDLGDAWVGTALTDPLRFFAKPYKTVAAAELETFLFDTFTKEKISIAVVGYPKTMQGTESDQTRLVVATKEKLEQMFPQIQWVLWDERLSSKQARSVKNPKNKTEKLEQHSIAAAIILESYLPYLATLQAT
ncbi:Holliday junction resolvase RuvX [Candidatus Babeliales bacterium]|nr:Holliday junction resolvase RuvX [Candidatus Babeliales bacterium]MBP9844310.1 Holliday junction resolvase RuvX [Candidatus Babeliales bacterium]